jgi:hypothetical protein
VLLLVITRELLADVAIEVGGDDGAVEGLKAATSPPQDGMLTEPVTA